MIDWDKQFGKSLTRRGIEACEYARSLWGADGIDFTPEQLLLGLINNEKSAAANICADFGGIEELRRLLEAEVQVSGSTESQPLSSGRGLELIEATKMISNEMRHPYIGTEHLLLGILSISGSKASRELENLGLTLEVCRTKVFELLGVK
jgi:ATP-dependent Clp protease ATP-binding subunit ClpC